MNAITPTLRQPFEHNRAAIDAANEVLCKKCDGTGQIVEYCGNCDGCGTVPPAGNGPYWDCEREECVECGGHGEFDIECPGCEGHGFVELAEALEAVS